MKVSLCCWPASSWEQVGTLGGSQSSLGARDKDFLQESVDNHNLKGNVEAFDEVAPSQLACSKSSPKCSNASAL